MVWSRARSGALSPRHLKQVRRDDKILALYGQGFSYDQIAASTGYANASGPHKAVRRALDRVPHVDQVLDARIEYQRLEALHEVLWAELNSDPTPRRQDQLISRLLAVADLQATLTANFAVELAPITRRRPERSTGVWTDALARRANGATLDDLATHLGLSDRSAARKRLRRDLDDYLADTVTTLRATRVGHLDALQYELWPAAIATPPALSAVDAVLNIIGRRVDLLGLAPADPAEVKPKRGRQGRPHIPPLTGRETIIAYPLPLRGSR